MVALGGAAGSVLRVTLTAAFNAVPTGSWKIGTLMVNLLGCLFFGFIWAKADMKMQLEAPATIAVLGGFLGAFTTFSAFGFHTVELYRQQDYVWAAVNLITNNGLGIAMMFTGIAAARALTQAG